MSALIESFLANDGKAKFIESIEQNALKGKNILLLGGFIEEFARALKQQGVNFSSLESQNEFKDSIQVFLLHPLNLNSYPKILHFLYEVGSEEAIIALLVSAFYSVYGGDLELKTFVESLDVGNLASECNLSEEELEQIARSFKSQKSMIVVGKDLNTHKRVHNIGKILALLARAFSQIEIIFLESAPKEVTARKKMPIETLEGLECYNGLVAYLQNKPLEEPILEVSKQFSQVGKIQEEGKIEVQFLESQKTIQAKLHKNMELKGMVGILWIPLALDFKDFLDLNNGFCYKQVKISKVA
ncbi:hypothetical protein [uncultured Helicobacter sp.]|uniref:hypothetical protein n=1 Tax=uncultured Helicobacter sp. TaxID=175537 RepID=UPI002607F919|nr:hypothetical protein [uncultured Helicobacter sp.]